MMPKIFTYANQDVLAGLVWAPGKQAGFLRRAPLALTWADRMALVPEAAGYRGMASLLACLTGGLGEETHKARVLVAYTDDPGADDTTVDDPAADDPARGLFFAAVVVNGKPALGAELLGHIDVECSSGQIDRLATTPCLAKEIHSPIPVSYLGGAVSGPTSEPVRVEGKPASKRPLWQMAAIGGGISALALVAGVLLLLPVQQSRPFEPHPVAAVQLTVRDEAGFARNCLAAFAGEWPISPGWQLVSEGCATPDMRDPALANLAGSAGRAPAHAVAYRIWQLRSGFDPAIARKVAEAVYAGRANTATRAATAADAAPTGAPGAATRAVHMEIRGNRLFSSTQIAVPMRVLTGATASEPSAEPLTPAALLAATEAVFLGLADSIVLDSGGGSRGHAPKVRVTLNSGFAGVFERTARLKGAEIARLNRNGETVTLDIIPRQIITVPVAEPVTGEIAGKNPDTQEDEAL